MSLPSQNAPELVTYVKEANLTFFFHDRLAPITAMMTSGDTPPNTLVDFLQAELLEAFVWLHSGVRIGYFPDVLSRRVFYEHSHLFLSAYEAVLESKLMDTWFPSPIRNIWESEFTGRQQLFSSGQRWTDSAQADNFVSTLQTLFLLANGFAQDLKVRPFAQALTLSSDAVWERLTTSWLPIIDGLKGVTESEPASDWISDGFLAVMQYMQAVRRAIADIRVSLPSGEVSAISLYADLLKQAQQWRLNFGYTGPRLRFLQIARIVANECVARVGTGQINRSGVVEGFLKEIEQLMRAWGAPQAAIAG